MFPGAGSGNIGGATLELENSGDDASLNDGRCDVFGSSPFVCVAFRRVFGVISGRTHWDQGGAYGEHGRDAEAVGVG